MTHLETPAECRRIDRIERPSLLAYWDVDNENGRWQYSLWDRGKTLPLKGKCVLTAKTPLEMITVNMSVAL